MVGRGRRAQRAPRRVSNGASAFRAPGQARTGLQGGFGMCETVHMKNITVTIDDEVHRRARIRAAERGTSVSAAVRDFLVRWSGEETEFDRLKRLQDETLRSIKGFSAGNRLPREELYRRGRLR